MNVAVLSRAWTAVRAADWWAYKIPPLLATAYAGFISFDLPAGAWATASGALAGILFVAVYGYVLNDVCDIEADRLSNRPNRMAAVGPAGRTAWLAIPLIAVGAIGWWIGDPILLALLGVNLLLPTLYSVPPARLKGRGPWGVLADAAGVHAVPTAIVARAVTLGADAGWFAATFVTSAVGCALFTGLRGIIVHQVADRRADRLAGVGTFAAACGVESSRRLVLRWLLPAELICLAVFLSLVLPWAPVVAVVVGLFVAVEFARMRLGWTLPLFEPPGESLEPYIPVVSNEVYEVWLPFGLALHLALAHPAFVAVLAVQTFLFFPNLRTRLAGVGRLMARGKAEVIIGATTWTVNGVNVFSANLARGLMEAGVPSHVLLTEEGSDLVQSQERVMPTPAGVTFRPLPTSRTDGWGMHWGAMVRYLEEAAPCIYIPNSDWRHSCVCPRLSDQVIVVGIVHSDDPLHYDHVRRLGPYWNAIVAVSGAVAQRTAKLCPEIADRIVTIPIGVRIPRSLPRRVGTNDRLRLIYHGILKQHQKRVLDLPRIVQAALDLGVPVELSIVGAGPDEAALREAATPLVDRGSIRFLGVVSPDDAPALLEAHDVYLLASEFEGMPNALIEAMGRGCVPVVTRTTSGIPELIQDGDNGFMVPIGDAGAFADRLRTLWTDPARRGQMSARAFRSVRQWPFRVQDMVNAYRQVFDRASNEARSGRFVRPRGPLSPPPPQVAGVSLFPVALPHVEPDVGAFPSVEDAEDYDDQVRATSKGSLAARAKAHVRSRKATSQISLEGVRVVVSVPVWTCNGVNLWSEDLVRGLRHAGLDARLLLTEEATDLVHIDEPRLTRPRDLPIDELRVNGLDNWGARWGAMLAMLEAAAPCIYFPNYDWRHSCVVPALSDRITVVGTLHDTGGLYTDHAARLGKYWNAVVATSRPIARHVRRQFPQLEDRLATIPHGLSIPATLVQKPRGPDGAAAVLIVGAADGGSEDTGWIEGLTQALARCDGAFRIAVVGPPPSLHDALNRIGAQIVMGTNRTEWQDLCQGSRFVVSNTLQAEPRRMMIEAMGHGCIPVFVGCKPPDDRLVRDGDDGVVAPGGTWETTVRRLQELASDPQTRDRMAMHAHSAARNAGYRSDQMIATYLDLFRSVIAAATAGDFQRSRGPILPPPALVGSSSVFPVELGHHTDLGPFPTAEDAERFREETGVKSHPAGSPP